MAKPKAQEDPPRQVAAAPVPPDARNELEATISALQKLHKAQSQARELRQEAAAAAATSPAAHDRLLEAAREKEVEARGYGKMVRRMQSGTWQGLFGGGGIGVGVGMGLG
jgi:predicted ATPase